LMPRTRRLHQQAPRSLFAVHGKVYTSTSTSPPAAAALPHLCRAPRLLVTRPHGLYLDLAVHCDYSSSGCTGSTAPMAWIRTRRLAAQLLIGSTSATPCAATTPVASAIHHLLCTATTRHPVALATSTSPCAASTCLPAAAALPQLRRASGCLGSSRGSSSTTSRTPRVRVPRHVVRLVARLVIDYFDYAACPGASARHAARHAARRSARRRLLSLRRAPRYIA
jgi:hypothetical protein